MSDDHERFRELAVGHVVGGLDPAEAAEFRSHLLGCRDCRARVAELRGIASDLERAERDERARTVVRTEVARRGADGDDGLSTESGSRVGVRHVAVAAIVVALLAGAMAFWNLHLRTTNAIATSAAEQRADVLGVLASGVVVPLEAERPVEGVAAIDGERVAVALTGVSYDRERQRLVLWLGDDGETTPVTDVLANPDSDGRVALSVADRDADELLVTVEQGELTDAPRGRRIARVPLQAESGADGA